MTAQSPIWNRTDLSQRIHDAVFAETPDNIGHVRIARMVDAVLQILDETVSTIAELPDLAGKTVILRGPMALDYDPVCALSERLGPDGLVICIPNGDLRVLADDDLASVGLVRIPKEV